MRDNDNSPVSTRLPNQQSDMRPMAPRSPMITGSFRDREAADRAYSSLLSKGYTEKDIHVIMSADTRKKFYGEDIKIDHGHKALSGAGVGGAVGGAVGATLVGILAAAAAVTIPGLGLVIVGPLAGALAGGAAGAAAGGLVGSLVGAGIPEERAKVYEKDLKDGAIVLGVNARHDDDAAYFENEWRTSGQHIHR